MNLRRGLSIAARVVAVQAVAALLIAGGITLFLVAEARRTADDRATAESLVVAETVAANPLVVDHVRLADATAVLQPYTNAILADGRVDFVTIMTPGGIRITHPDPSQIGKRFLGGIAAAQRGGELTQTYTGTLGPSVRAVVPVEEDGRVIGLVAAGITTAKVDSGLGASIPLVIGVAVLVALIGAAAALLTWRVVRRAAGRLAPGELSRMVGFYESVLHSVREGVVLADARGRVVLYNDEAAELLELPPAATDPRPVDPEELGIPAELASPIREGERIVEELRTAGGRILLVNQEPAVGAGRAAGDGRHPTVMTLRDESELRALLGELESTLTMAEGLRAQSHEHANRLHTVLSLIETGRDADAVELIESSTQTSQRIADRLVEGVSDPVLAALLLGKSAQANERGVDLGIDAEEGLLIPLGPDATVSVIGNLLDNAIEAAVAGDAPRWARLRLRRVGDEMRIEVLDSGTAPDPALGDVFATGISSKGDAAHGYGLAIVRRLVERAGGGIRFSGEAPTRVEVRLPHGGER